MGIKTICAAPGCCNLVDKYSGHRYCKAHRSLEEQKERERAQRARERKPYATAKHNQWQELYCSAEWKRLKAEQLQKQPQCEICGDAATEVHHITPHNGVEEVFYDPYNLQSLCHACHLRATQRESWDRRREATQKKKQQPKKLWY